MWHFFSLEKLGIGTFTRPRYKLNRPISVRVLKITIYIFIWWIYWCFWSVIRLEIVHQGGLYSVYYVYCHSRWKGEIRFIYITHVIRAYQNSNIWMKYSFRNEGMQYLLKLRSCPFIDITYVYEQSYNCIIVQNGLF